MQEIGNCKYYKLQSKVTGLFLDGNKEGKVYDHTGNKESFQQWRFISVENGFYKLQSRETWLFLDGNEKGNIYGHTENDGALFRTIRSL